MTILGLGVRPDADLAAIKKMVDALRFNWHPDRARDDQDRHARELRIRQINAAWEILAGGARSDRPTRLAG
jgi:curved DNA-binding protein CbpA